MANYIGTDELKGLSTEQLRGIYREFRGMMIAYGKFASVAEFDAKAKERVQHFSNAKIVKARDFTAYAANLVIHHNLKKVAIEPSEESLNWGGFLGGEIIWLDNEEVNALVREIIQTR